MLLNPEAPAAFSNVLILVAALTLLGPAISAGMYSARAQVTDEEPKPLRAFWRGYRRNFFDVLRIWFPSCVMLGLIVFAIQVSNVTGMQLGNLALLAWASVVVIWALLALTLSTFISMSTGGIARLALLYIGRTWKVALGFVAIMLIAFFVTRLPGGIFMLAVLSAVMVALMYFNAKPMIADATTYYTVTGVASHDALD